MTHIIPSVAPVTDYNKNNNNQKLFFGNTTMIEYDATRHSERWPNTPLPTSDISTTTLSLSLSPGSTPGN